MLCYITIQNSLQDGQHSQGLTLDWLDAEEEDGITCQITKVSVWGTCKGENIYIIIALKEPTIYPGSMMKQINTNLRTKIILLII